MAAQGTSRPHTGLVTAAGIILLIAGAYNVLAGIAGASRDEGLDTYPGSAGSTGDSDAIFGLDFRVLGWVWLIVGIIQVVAAVLIFGRRLLGQQLGVIVATFSAVTMFFAFFYFPLLATAIIAIDVFVLYVIVDRRDEFA